jgi:SPP1 family predicted phage head-tail adaptor
MKGAGRLDRVINIKRDTMTFDDYGQPVTDSTTSTQVFAEVIQPGSAVESLKAAQVYPERTVSFVIRHPNPTDSPTGFTFNESDTIEFDGIEHDILGIIEIGRRDGLTIYCKRRGTHDV